MENIKLFKRKNGTLKMTKRVSFDLEKDIQKLCEENLEEIFGVELMRHEWTPKGSGKRLDTLGIDKENSPVVIEYKLDKNRDVIKQGNEYIDYLLDHQEKFDMQCWKKFKETREANWSRPRLICVASDFTKGDDKLAKQLTMYSIELIKYLVYADGDIVFGTWFSSHKSKPAPQESKPVTQESKPVTHGKKPATQSIKGVVKENLSAETRLLFEEIEAFIFALGNDVQDRKLKYYITYVRIKDFVYLIPKQKSIRLCIKTLYAEMKDPPAFVIDIANKGHWTPANTEIRISSPEHFKYAKPYIEQAYEAST